MIQAKPVVPDRYWILTDTQGKVGNIVSHGTGYAVRIGEDVMFVDDIAALSQKIPVSFEVHRTPEISQPEMHVHGYPTSSPAHNPVWDAKRQIPLWTQDASSRSWLAAGWYRVLIHRNWRTMLCPKKIILERYAYQGPFRTQQEAQQS
jgi:hypothetical protein